MTVLTWAQYDRLPAAQQAELVNIRLPSGETAWRHRSGAAVTTAPAPRLSDAEYRKLTPQERYEYCRSWVGHLK